MIRKASMPLLILVVFLSLDLFYAKNANGQENTADEAEASIEKLLERYRQAAAKANSKEFFGCLDPAGTFFGTDEKERYTLSTLKSAYEPYFEKGIGWKRKVLERHVYVGPNLQIGWFEEKTARDGVSMRVTGVVRKTDRGWKIVQHNTAFAIPNEIYPQLVELVGKVKKSKTTESESPGKTKTDK